MIAAMRSPWSTGNSGPIQRAPARTACRGKLADDVGQSRDLHAGIGRGLELPAVGGRDSLPRQRRGQHQAADLARCRGRARESGHAPRRCETRRDRAVDTSRSSRGRFPAASSCRDRRRAFWSVTSLVIASRNAVARRSSLRSTAGQVSNPRHAG